MTDRPATIGGRVAGKRVVITGSSKGLGRAFAVALAADGARVVVNGTDGGAVSSVVEEITGAGGTATGLVGSVADDAVAAALVERCVEAYGGIDVAIPNAAIVHTVPFVDTSPEVFDQTVAVNLRGTWSVCQHAARAMRDAGTGGHLLLVSSRMAVATGGLRFAAAYAATKGAVMGLLYALSGELAPYGVRVNALSPVALSGTTVPAVQELQAEQRAAGQPPASAGDMGLHPPEAVAPLVVHLCSDQAGDLRNQMIRFDGRRLALWAHPREALVIDRPDWTPASVAANFPGHQEPATHLVHRD
ncbi:MAG TPA: SDR family NAD(P)-dependent oxidoreductase [Acidimicrobiales bacterium]|nr:SDR family NAD(P)-dependent oxidoreductase [Acidimicrobiales bacterium]